MKRLAIAIASISLFFAVGIYFTKAYKYRQYCIEVKDPSPKSYHLNINLAKVTEFDNLPGIGPKLAQSIVDYRNQQGRFKAIDEISKVKGIGDKKFAEIEKYLTMEVD